MTTMNIKVRNRGANKVVYSLPEFNNTRRVFEAYEEKNLSVEELIALSYAAGGLYLLQNSLVIDDEHIAKQILNHVEPEYFYTEKDVDTLLLTGSLDAFMDALDFAPAGVVEVIKKRAVELKINDLSKRIALLNSTGYDVTKAIELTEASEEEATEAAPKTRRVNANTATEEAPVRRTPSGYTVIKSN